MFVEKFINKSPVFGIQGEVAYYIRCPLSSIHHILWKDGTHQITTGWRESQTHLWECPGFWETREEAEIFLKKWVSENLSNAEFAEVIANEMLR